MPITLSASDPTPDLRPLQTYLDHVRSPRQRLDCRGRGVEVRVLDGGWRFDHEALNNPYIFRRVSQSGVREMDIKHGTSVLGILAGLWTMQGICPDALIRPRLWFTLQGELRDAADTLSRGDVLLIERCLGAPPLEMPVETSPDLLPGILDCASKGIIVVEPAGNSNLNLDPYIFDTEHRAIMVGGAHVWPDGTGWPERRIAPTADTSYGARVDVCAPAWEGITCGPSDYIDGPDPLRHYGMFGGTSMASAIVAGVCAGINSARLAAGKNTLDSQGMRDLLVWTGQDVAYPRCPIGKFIDVTKALQTTLPDPDFDMDDMVGWGDFFEFAACWNAQDMRADFDGDGAVSWRDFNVLRRRFGAS